MRLTWKKIRGWMRSQTETNVEQVQVIPKIFHPSASAPDFIEEISTSNLNQCHQQMLTVEDLKYNFAAIRLLCWLKIIPYNVNSESTSGFSMTVKGEDGKFSDWFLKWFWKIFGIVRTAWIVFSAISYYILREDVGVADLYIRLTQMVVAFDTVPLIWCSFHFLHLHKAAHVTVTNGFLQGLEADVGNHDAEKWRWLPHKRSMDLSRPFRELILIFCPFLIFGALTLIPMVVLVAPRLSVLMASVTFDLVEKYGWLSWYPWGICVLAGLLTLDLVFYFYMMAILYYAMFHILLGMIRIMEDVQKGVERARQGIAAEIVQAAKRLQVAELQISLFNLEASSVVYASKIVGMVTAILGGFGAILYMQVNLPFCILFAEICAIASIAYGVMYNRAFQITEKTEELKTEILKGAQESIRDREQKEEITRIIRSIPCLGIRVGGFYGIERESTLIFLDFCVGEIVELLLTFR